MGPTACEMFPALGGTAVVAVADGAMLPVAVGSVKEIVRAFDQACSSFREDSELSRLNAARGAPVGVSALLFDAVQVALRAAVLTDGDVDPTIGQALSAIADHGPLTVVPVPGWRVVELDERRRTIRVPSGVKLDLGATAKALAADRAAAAAATTVACGVLVGLSGDISLAGTAPDEGWRVRVTDDHRAETTAPGQWVTLRSGGLATSSTTVRRWTTRWGVAHHVVDPATGGAADVVWRTASVTAGSCLDANIASTAAIVRGGRAIEWLESLALPSRLVSAAGRAVHVAGWPSEGDDLR